ncbi:MAG: YihA family ribosome biogenesis GTP-binding protein [Flavobacteriales bacterium]|nr:YihA family ribosome biogenesis GTP-binding protein [Flavobacteriales bacterium]MBO73159.1 YihA family ribosome biogenesis GTP-binding protein [Flavobacteriales bacterium]|tara:strand:+ start:1363 stop:1965 length:603 start_codon:yes stop_codon:yes gene_type:complete
MKITSSKFIISKPHWKECPAPNFPEYAFIGRSNVGKSSLINTLCEKKGLAKTSSTPGKTQLINHFLINEKWYLCDLPGYGYAKVSKKSREEWSKMIKGYILNRKNLLNTFVLIDSRLKPQKIDIDFMIFLGENGVPFSIIFTKTDKLKQKELSLNVKTYEKELYKYWEELPPYFITSSEKKLGKEKILDYIENINPLFKK